LAKEESGKTSISMKLSSFVQTLEDFFFLVSVLVPWGQNLTGFGDPAVREIFRLWKSQIGTEVAMESAAALFTPPPLLDHLGSGLPVLTGLRLCELSARPFLQDSTLKRGSLSSNCYALF